VRATDITRAPCNLRNAVEITRGPVRLSRPTFALMLLTAFTTGLVGQHALHQLLTQLFP
jgi:hypothetical protein